MKIVLSGGTGFIGKALLNPLIKAGHRLVLLTRDVHRIKRAATAACEIVEWDGHNSGPWVQMIDGADAVINLAGAPIAERRWTVAQKERIVASRVGTTRLFVEAIEQAKQRPSVWINASAVGYYGHVPEGVITEHHPQGAGFLAKTCGYWEGAALAAEKLGVRVICLRTGVVLEKDGGALPRMLLPFRMFLGGPLGSGRQWFPWIHREDVVEIILFALTHPLLSGAINVTAPNSVTMKEFCRTLGKVMQRPSWLPVPSFVLQLIFGEMSEVLLDGQRAVPKKLLEAGYAFHHPKLDECLSAVLKTNYGHNTHH